MTEDDERWTSSDYLTWVAILVALALIGCGAYLVAIALGEAVL